MSCWPYIQSDLYRYTGKVSLYLFLKHLARNKSFKYSFWLRLARHQNWLVRTIAKFFHRHLSGKYLLEIPVSTDIGYGLYIGHHMCVVINETAKIGNNVNLSQFTTIGSNEGNAAVIGDNVYIGPSVCLVENVQIGNDVTIGAGSVVTRDIPPQATVAGVPAKVLNFNNAGRYVQNRWPLKSA
jgi:serine O-acetyltransferase